MALAELWGMPRDRGDPVRKKSGRVISLAEVKITCATPDTEPTKKKPMSGWRKAAHEQKQKLFEPKPVPAAVIETPDRTPIIPTKPVFHVTCGNTGVKIEGGRYWPCHCGRPATFAFKRGDYAPEEDKPQPIYD